MGRHRKQRSRMRADRAASSCASCGEGSSKDMCTGEEQEEQEEEEEKLEMDTLGSESEGWLAGACLATHGCRSASSAVSRCDGDTTTSR
mmetsp:Transcript_89179/g.238097  ORF Transcript_89179/g.238097 Transcript_89179/m.238097 type:complete len:89 (+) Transcript_89179:59-325(+)